MTFCACECLYKGGGSATAMAVPIVKQKVGMVNVEALKRAWHSISCACAVCVLEKGLAYLRAISMVGRALASSQLDGCYGPFGMSASTWTRLQLSKSALSGRKLSFIGSSNMPGFQNCL